MRLSLIAWGLLPVFIVFNCLPFFGCFPIRVIEEADRTVYRHNSILVVGFWSFGIIASVNGIGLLMRFSRSFGFRQTCLSNMKKWEGRKLAAAWHFCFWCIGGTFILMMANEITWDWVAISEDSFVVQDTTWYGGSRQSGVSFKPLAKLYIGTMRSGKGRITVLFCVQKHGAGTSTIFTNELLIDTMPYIRAKARTHGVDC